MNMRLIALGWLLAIYAAPAVLGQTTIITSTSAGDGFFHDEVGSSYDYFDSTSTTVQAHYELWSTSDTLRYNTGYLQFNLTSAPAVADITAVTLSLYLTEIHFSSDSTTGGYIKHAANSSGATGSASQKVGGSELVVEIQNQTLGWNTFDVTNLILNDLNAGYGYVAFSANPSTSGYFRNAGFSFYSADFGSYQPTLTFTGSAVPEPTQSVVVAGVASLLVLLRRRSRKAPSGA